MFTTMTDAELRFIRVNAPATKTRMIDAEFARRRANVTATQMTIPTIGR